MTIRATRPTWRVLGSLVLGAALWSWASAGRAQDTDQVRFYLSGRAGAAILLDGRPVTGLEAGLSEQTTGVSLGVNLGRYFGLELAADGFEKFLRSRPDVSVRPGPTLGEFSVGTLIPQVRFRYPLLDGWLTPYVVAGVGVGHHEFNDRKQAGRGLSIHGRDTGVVAAIGGGVEYFVASNVALGVEARYLVDRDQEIEFQGRRERADLDAILVGLSMRLLYPDTPRAARSEAAAFATDGRVYAALRPGGAVSLRSRVGSGLEVEPENAALGPFNHFGGLALGLDFQRRFSVELAVEGYEPILKVPGLGRVSEYGFWTVLPQARLRFPVRENRLVPYLVAGVGVSFTEVNDVKRDPDVVKIKGNSVIGAAGSVGAGIEYLVTDNLAVGAETKYIIARGHSVTLNSREVDVELDALFTSLAVRIYFGRGGR